MYSQINRMCGRMVASTSLQSPLLPITPGIIHRGDVPEIVHTATKMALVSEYSSTPSPRRLMPGTNIPFPPVSEEIKRKQALFQKDDGVPVHLKGGVFDVVLYRTTWLLCIIGLGGVGHSIYTLS